MSVVTVDVFSRTISDLLTLIADSHNVQAAQIAGIESRQSQLFTRVNRLDTTQQQVWDAIADKAEQTQITELWTKQGQQDKSIGDIWAYTNEINERLSRQVTQLGQSVSQAGAQSSILGGLGIGLSTTTLALLGVGAFFLLRGKS